MEYYSIMSRVNYIVSYIAIANFQMYIVLNIFGHMALLYHLLLYTFVYTHPLCTDFRFLLSDTNRPIYGTTVQFSVESDASSLSCVIKSRP